MNKLLIATNNKGKVKELQELLKNTGLQLVTPAATGQGLRHRRAVITITKPNSILQTENFTTPIFHLLAMEATNCIPWNRREPIFN